jgi:hypothetical protein
VSLHAGELRLEDNEPGLKAVIALPRAEPQVQGHRPVPEHTESRR